MPNSPERETSNRRDWLRSAARACVLGGMAMGAGWLAARGDGSGAHACGRGATCSGCRWLTCCPLPRRLQGGIKERSHD